ncbi:MAG: class I SAM-dependent methyltransferase [Anaerolineae bacterium]|nr:class I SAM-dependent methyltransferase [Anaerolineae bacterium]
MDDTPVALDSYEAMAERYAEAVRTKPYNAHLERPALRALLPEVRGFRILDAGCGAGINLPWLLEQGAREVVGVDVSPRMLALARQEAPSPQVALHVADLGRPLDFLVDASFDGVFSSLVVHYIRDQAALFAEFARLLRPGGFFVFSTHHPYADHQWHGGSYFETRLVTDEWRMAGEPMTVSYYRRPLSAVTGALAGAGFVIDRLTEALPTPEFQRLDPEGYARQMEKPSFLCVRATCCESEPPH